MNNLNILAAIITAAASLATTSDAFASPQHLSLPSSACDKHTTTPLFAADDIPFFATDTATAQTDDNDCGPGFQKIQGADGPCCAFDYQDEVSSKLGPLSSIFDNNPALQAKYDEKNRARSNFNLKRLSPEEFVVLQAQIHAMEEEESAIQAVARQAAVEQREQRRAQQQEELEEGKSRGLLQSFFGSFQDTCQSNYDCDRPEVCCDFGFKKVCCSEGNTRKYVENELALIPVQQTV